MLSILITLCKDNSSVAASISALSSLGDATALTELLESNLQYMYYFNCAIITKEQLAPSSDLYSY